MFQTTTHIVSFCCTCSILWLLPQFGLAQEERWSATDWQRSIFGVPVSRAGGQLGHLGVQFGMTATEERILWEALHRYDDRDWQGANLEHLPALVAPRIALVMNEDELDLCVVSQGVESSFQTHIPPRTEG